MTIKLKPLDQQVIVVTGASSGIGLATARTAAARGARVLLVARSGDVLAEEVKAIVADGGAADWKVADVGDWEQMRAAAAHAVQRFGRIDTWVNDAGVTIYAKLADTPGDEHERLFRTNYFGTVHGCQAALPHLAEHGGAIVTVGSIVSDLPSPVQGAYAASKHAIKAYVAALRMEVAADGVPVSVSLIKPSGIDTPIAQHAVNHVGGAAQVPPPSYDPQLVADAILDAATRPVREITVGGAGLAQVLFYQHFKALAEKLMPIAAATFTAPGKTQPVPSNLFVGNADARVHSGENSPRRFSTYTAAARHPVLVWGAIGGLVALTLALRGDTRRSAKKWSGREDSNLRPLPPEGSALPG